jgi:signal transduction histidine kinase
VRSEGDLQPRRPRAGRPHRPSGAPAVAALALDHVGALIGMDAGWVIRSATGGLKRLVGRSPEEVLGHSLRSLLEPDTAEATIAGLAGAVQSETRTVVPGTLVGSRPVLLAPLPRPAPSAELYVVVTDLHGSAVASAAASGPDRAEVFRARLAETEDRFVEAALLFEVTAELSGSLDPADVLPRIVDHGARLCGAHSVALEVLDPETGLLSVAAVSGGAPCPASDAVPPATILAGRPMAPGTVVELGGDQAERQSARYAAGNEPERFRTSLAVPLVVDGTAVGALVFCRAGTGPFEPTAVHRAQELARWAALAIRNARRYTELRRELAELREGQTRLVQAEKGAALARLGGGAAHEINNPLAVVVGNAELLLRREPLTPDATERVERILLAAHRVARVVRQILLFVRAHPPDLAPTDVVALLRDQAAAAARDLELDGVRVIDELERVPVVQADARQLAQVFANILDNALDAARALPPEQERIIRLSSGFQHGRLRLRIENSGSPIADESLPRIFDLFFTTKAVGQGAGLGLSVCHGIITAHGGRIVAENLPHGVAIIVELPAGGTPDAPDPRPAA